MINFLPPQQKEFLLAEERLKLVLVFGIVVLAFIVSFFLELFLVRIFLVSQFETQKIISAAKEKNLETGRIKDLEEEIRKYNSTFSNLELFYQKQTKPSRILEDISQSLPSGLYLTNFNFVSNKIYLSGFSPDRQGLLLFKENLEKENKNKNIYFPPSNWLEKTNINFIVNFTYEP